jgi:predicted ATP-grasp superfamily ATP-dependent carboligase
MGSNSKSVKLTSDKLLTYRRIKELSPKTEAYMGKTSLDFPLIAKPRDGVSCEGVMRIEDGEDLEQVPEGYLVQEYIWGRPMSASLIAGDEIRVVSINTQELNDFEYLGAKLPVEISNTDPIVEAVHRFPGLCGYVGVDFMLLEDGEPLIIEINPRPTTPIIGINGAFGINISRTILDNYQGKKILENEPVRKIHVKKSRSESGFVTHKGYSIEVRETHEDFNA